VPVRYSRPALLIIAVFTSSALAEQANAIDTRPGADAQSSGFEVVNYDTGNGVIETTVDVPGNSGLSRGRGSGGSPAPCGTFPYEANYFDPLHPNFRKAPPTAVDPVTGDIVITDPDFTKPVEFDLESTMWEFTEILNTTPVTNERQLQDFLYRDYDVEGWHRYKDNTQPLETLMRRFSMECNYVAGTNSTIWSTRYLGTTDVSIRDPFFQVEEAAQRLRARIQLDPLIINTMPDESTWGGLVVNAPTHLSINSTPWKIYSDTEPGRGVTLTQTVSPRSLEFQIVFTPKGGDGSDATVIQLDCLNTRSLDAARLGQIPAVPHDFPEFAVEDPALPCTWLPTEKGTVTIRAMVVYDVIIHVGGYSEPQAPFVWISQPVNITVGELIAVNTIGN
jgi:hypothetical protein